MNSRKPPRTIVIACDVLRDEVELLRADMDHILRVDYLPMGLHDTPNRMRAKLLNLVKQAEDDLRTEAVVLVYGLCGKGTAGLSTTRVPLVLPRAHDCITLFLGSAKRYAEYQKKHPEAYYYTPGWMRGKRTPGPERIQSMREELAERFDDPDDIEYLIDMERQGWENPHRATYIDLGLSNRGDFPEMACNCAARLNWKFEQIQGDPTLLRDTLAGNWDDERHLFVQPGTVIAASHDDQIVKANPRKS